METEIDFENPTEELLPGMYAETVVQLAATARTPLIVPIEAVMQNRGSTSPDGESAKRG